MLIVMQDCSEYGPWQTSLLSVLKNITQCLTVFSIAFTLIVILVINCLFSFIFFLNTKKYQIASMQFNVSKEICAKRSWSVVANIYWTHSKWCQNVIFPPQCLTRASREPVHPRFDLEGESLATKCKFMPHRMSVAVPNMWTGSWLCCA